MTLGLIPRKYTIRYGNIRDRVRSDGTHWLQPELLSFFNTKLEDSNQPYSKMQFFAKFIVKWYKKAFKKRFKKWL